MRTGYPAVEDLFASGFIINLLVVKINSYTSLPLSLDNVPILPRYIMIRVLEIYKYNMYIHNIRSISTERTFLIEHNIF